MKKIIKFLPLIISILLLIYSTYAFSKIKGFKIFELTTSMGMFYASTYRYAAIIGFIVFFIYLILFFAKIINKRKAVKMKNQ